jgi:hypothetical protein
MSLKQMQSTIKCKHFFALLSTKLLEFYANERAFPKSFGL